MIDNGVNNMNKKEVQQKVLQNGKPIALNKFTWDSKTRTFITFKTSCTFKTSSDCIIVRRDVFEVIHPKENDEIQLFPYTKKGYLINGLYNGNPNQCHV